MLLLSSPSLLFWLVSYCFCLCVCVCGGISILLLLLLCLLLCLFLLLLSLLSFVDMCNINSSLMSHKSIYMYTLFVNKNYTIL